MGSGIIASSFPEMGRLTSERFEQLEELYTFWNKRINVISRKDISNLYINHILHSLSLSKVIPFSVDETALDMGTGGGFPGIPLAIMHPETHFTLIDATGKKIKVVDSIAGELGLTNVHALHSSAENFSGRFHYLVSRAVCSFTRLVELSAGKLLNDNRGNSSYGIYSLKGGDLHNELAAWKEKVKIFEISSFFSQEFFRTKFIVFLPAGAGL